MLHLVKLTIFILRIKCQPAAPVNEGKAHSSTLWPLSLHFDIIILVLVEVPFGQTSLGKSLFGRVVDANPASPATSGEDSTGVDLFKGLLILTDTRC